jgi:hypothetical protein
MIPTNIQLPGDSMKFRLQLTPLIVVIILAMSSLSQGAAAAQCTTSELRELGSLANRLKTDLHRFENARIKEICRVGRPLLASVRRVDSWIRRHPECMITARDRRRARQLSSEVRRASAEYRRACG